MIIYRLILKLYYIMKNRSNNNISQERDDSEDIDLLLDNFKTALKNI